MRRRFFILSSVITVGLGLTTAAHAAPELLPDRSKSAWIAFQMAQSSGSGNSVKGSSERDLTASARRDLGGPGSPGPGTVILGAGPGTSASERLGGKPRLP